MASSEEGTADGGARPAQVGVITRMLQRRRLDSVCSGFTPEPLLRNVELMRPGEEWEGVSFIFQGALCQQAAHSASVCLQTKAHLQSGGGTLTFIFLSHINLQFFSLRDEALESRARPKIEGVITGDVTSRHMTLRYEGHFVQLFNIRRKRKYQKIYFFIFLY